MLENSYDCDNGVNKNCTGVDALCSKPDAA